jgi:hypothetical protein
MNATPPATDAAISQTSVRATRDILHLTNGSAIIPKIREAGVRGHIVPWNDVLHEGPVPAGLGAAALRDLRADFIAGCGWGPRIEILKELEARDRALDLAIGDLSGGAKPPELQAPGAQEIVLWFEHDLYDQLHLIQILDRVPVDGGPRVTIVPAATYLGHQPASDYPALFERRRDVSSPERSAARDAWAAFRSADPRSLIDALPRVTVLPNLGPALRRHVEQFPSTRNGLSRTEQQTLEVVARGVTLLRDVFIATQEREEAFFMGDSGYLFHISSLIRSHRPLLKTTDARAPFVPSDMQTFDLRVELTTLGAAVLANESDRVELVAIDRWLGGVHLSGNGPVWRWDGDRQSLRFA